MQNQAYEVLNITEHKNHTSSQIIANVSWNELQNAATLQWMDGWVLFGALESNL